jgi:hypothetical protein
LQAEIQTRRGRARSIDAIIHAKTEIRFAVAFAGSASPSFLESKAP